MRIVSYNILNGGEGRADPLAEILLAQRPDVVALVEADNLAVVERIAKRLRMDYVVAERKPHSLALLSRPAIRDSVHHLHDREEAGEGFLEATVAVSGKELVIGVVHLHARASIADEQRRLTQIAGVLDVTAPYRAARRPHLLAGDFNSISPIQSVTPADLKPETRAAHEANGNMLPREAIARIEQAGYVDALRAVHPRRATTSGTFSTLHPGQRVDYIFAHGLGRRHIRDAWIERDRLAKYASDHYPVGAEFAL